MRSYARSHRVQVGLVCIGSVDGSNITIEKQRRRSREILSAEFDPEAVEFVLGSCDITHADLSCSEPQPPAPALTDNEIVDNAVASFMGECTCQTKVRIVRLSSGKYYIGETDKIVFIRSVLRVNAVSPCHLI